MAEDKDDTIAKLVAMNEEMRKRLDAIEGALPPAPAAEVPPGTKLEFPRHVYRESKDEKQIDHPGHETKIVTDQAALDEAVAQGWYVTPQDEYPEAPKAKGKKSA